MRKAKRESDKLKTISSIWNGKHILLLSHVDEIGGCWPDGRHWLAIIYTKSKTYHYWTGPCRFKAGRTVYYPSGSSGISLKKHVSVVSAQEQGAILNRSFVVSGVLEGSLMGRSASEYHRRIRSIPPVPSVESDPWVIDIVRIGPVGSTPFEWEVEEKVEGHIIENPKIDGLRFSFEIKKYWHPDPVALRQYYSEEQRKTRRKNVFGSVGKVVASFLERRIK